MCRWRSLCERQDTSARTHLLSIRERRGEAQAVLGAARREREYLDACNEETSLSAS